MTQRFLSIVFIFCQARMETPDHLLSLLMGKGPKDTKSFILLFTYLKLDVVKNHRMRCWSTPERKILCVCADNFIQESASLSRLAQRLRPLETEARR